MTKKSWYVYIIQTESGKLYTGITTDIETRFKIHKKNKGAKFFRMENPEKIFVLESYKTRSEASKKEYEIKQLKRNEKLKLLNIDS